MKRTIRSAVKIADSLFLLALGIVGAITVSDLIEDAWGSTAALAIGGVMTIVFIPSIAEDVRKSAAIWKSRHATTASTETASIENINVSVPLETIQCPRSSEGHEMVIMINVTDIMTNNKNVTASCKECDFNTNLNLNPDNK